jgi:hypothetical protein
MLLIPFNSKYSTTFHIPVVFHVPEKMMAVKRKKKNGQFNSPIDKAMATIIPGISSNHPNSIASYLYVSACLVGKTITSIILLSIPIKQAPITTSLKNEIVVS